jgi:hypothetical protein
MARLTYNKGPVHTLVYKRTHPGDPDVGGRFGINDCMGQVRSWDFDAVVGVGALGAEASSHGLDEKSMALAGILGLSRLEPGWRKPVDVHRLKILFDEATRARAVLQD